MSDGLLVKLTTLGSPYSINNGQDPYVNPLSTKQSTLHYDRKSNSEGWSVKGGYSPTAFKTVQDYVAYQDGVFNPIPFPTLLSPINAEGADPNYKLKYTSTQGYEQNSFF
jgi:hypothetical protein